MTEEREHDRSETKGNRFAFTGVDLDKVVVNICLVDTQEAEYSKNLRCMRLPQVFWFDTKRAL